MDVDGALLNLTTLVVVGLALWSLADSARRPAPSFAAAGKQSKAFWLAILVVSGLAAWFFGGLSLPGGVAAVASIVYLTDVRPALRGIGPGGSWG